MAQLEILTAKSVIETPRIFQRVYNPRHRLLVQEFLKFGTVGAIGFAFDIGTVYALRHVLGVYVAGIAAYLAAASVNWLLNRNWTFKGRSDGAAHRQWALFLAANLLGFVLNRGTFALMIMFFPFCAANPVIAVAGGAAIGMFVNFAMMKMVVFR